MNWKNEYQVEIIHGFDTWGYNCTEPTVKSSVLQVKTQFEPAEVKLFSHVLHRMH